MIEIYNEDCMELMARYSDKYFNLAIVDPPYGSATDFSGRGGAGRPCLAPVSEVSLTSTGSAMPKAVTPSKSMGRFPGRARLGLPNTKIVLPIGIMRRNRNILRNFSGFRIFKLYGEGIIIPCRRPEILLSGKN
jgi:hypothetical protein